MIGLDTYSWEKIIRLLDSEWKLAIDDIIDQLNIFITVEGKKEFHYRFPDHLFLLDKISILPVLHSTKYQNYLKKYDHTDASLLEYADIRSFRVVTEDVPMLEEAITGAYNIVQLIDLMFELYMVHNFFSNNEIIKLIRIFRSWRNITKKKAEYYRKIIENQ